MYLTNGQAICLCPSVIAHRQSWLAQESSQPCYQASTSEKRPNGWAFGTLRNVAMIRGRDYHQYICSESSVWKKEQWALFSKTFSEEEWGIVQTCVHSPSWFFSGNFDPHNHFPLPECLYRRSIGACSTQVILITAYIVYTYQAGIGHALC